MAVFTEESARANIRNRDGKRVFYLAEGDHLTPSAREFLRRERVEILPASQAKPDRFVTAGGLVLTEKPEHMTHLRAGVLVQKAHPRIRFRGAMDALEADLLLVGHQASGETAKNLQELLDTARRIIRCEVLEEPMELRTLGGLTLDQLREQSHHPEQYLGQPHFMPSFSDSELLLKLNRLRTQVRQAELLACDAFRDRDGAMIRQDLVTILNRMSSLLWIMIIRIKKEGAHG